MARTVVLVVGGDATSRRAIKACLERAGYAVTAIADVLICPRPDIALDDLPEFPRAQRKTRDGLDFDLPPRGISLEAVERTLILKALEKCNWNQSQAARYLDLSRKTLIYRMEKFRLRKAPRRPEVEASGVRQSAPSDAAWRSPAERISE